MSSVILLLALAWQLTGVDIRQFPDTTTYMELAGKKSFLDSLFAMRPFFSIVLFKIFSQHLSAYSYFQAILYVASWTYLFYVLSGAIKEKFILALVCLALLYFSLYPDFVLWIKTALTESVSISLSVMALAFFIKYLDKNNGRTLIALTGVLVLNAGLRDFNVYYSILYIPLLFAIGLIRGTKIKPVVLTIFGIAIACTFFIWSANNVGPESHETRWFFSMLNNVGKRILPNENFVKFYEAHGMPKNEALMQMTDFYGHENEHAFYTDPKLSEFRHWLRMDGKTTYVKLLIENPRYTFGQLWRSVNEIFQPYNYLFGSYAPENFKGIINIRLPYISLYFLDFFLLSVMLGVALYAGHRNARIKFAIGLGFIGLCFPLAFIAYHADAMEVARHALPVNLHAVLSLALFAYIIDDIWKSRCVYSKDKLPILITSLVSSSVFLVIFCLFLLSVPSIPSSNGKFDTIGSVYKWRGCKLSTIIGKYTKSCEIETTALAKSGFLAFGPYERLKRGKYSFEVEYVSSKLKTDTAGEWDVDVSLRDDIKFLEKGKILGTENELGLIKGSFNIDTAFENEMIQIRIIVDADAAMKVNYLKINRLE
ncbi:hypothetical protein [Undibacterium parvum]|uniref:Glycosyltransferase RgtA/B/C/D-like domain-containing protein n=2 Tax=Undibacterium TaxID=401469 RepID=A0A6M4A6F2_9BURK|nr:hypothetical protein [Undibacterium parvum]AZP11738.1 hypothetical protein EJN92_06855 [Undibacterium parvum]QJQ06177.1 hypothetical protein EJG51_010265 [Undibacterium piscinae]